MAKQRIAEALCLGAKLKASSKIKEQNAKLQFKIENLQGIKT